MTSRDRVFSFLGDLFSRTRRLLDADARFYLFIAAYMFAGLLFLAAIGASDQAAFSIYLWRWLFLFGFLLPATALGCDVVILLRRFRKRRRLAARRMFSPARLARLLAGLALLLGFGLFQATFTSIKNGLPYWRGGFLYDRLQADLDASIHFGVDPWRLLYKVAGSDLARTAIEWNYNVLWFIICFGGLFFVATSPMAAPFRTRYLVCFSAIWVLIGNLLAGLFLSAGPAFYGYVTGDTARFGDQLAFLARSSETPNSAAAYQNYLLTLYHNHEAGFASGISAFPSVHVALITMNALFLFEFSRKLGLLAFAYTLFVSASSVYLAWHYAIDGYASMAITVLIYLSVRKLAGLWVVRQDPALADAAPTVLGPASAPLS